MLQANPGTECCKLQWLTQAQSAASCSGSPRHRVLQAALAHPGTECCELHWLTLAQSAASCTGSPRHRVLQAALAHAGTECCKLQGLTQPQNAANCNGAPRNYKTSAVLCRHDLRRRLEQPGCESGMQTTSAHHRVSEVYLQAGQEGSRKHPTPLPPPSTLHSPVLVIYTIQLDTTHSGRYRAESDCQPP